MFQSCFQVVAAEPECHFSLRSLVHPNLRLCSGFLIISDDIKRVPILWNLPQLCCTLFFFNFLLLRGVCRGFLWIKWLPILPAGNWKCSPAPLSILVTFSCIHPKVGIQSKCGIGWKNLTFQNLKANWYFRLQIIHRNQAFQKVRLIFEVCILWLAGTYSEHLRQVRLPTLVSPMIRSDQKNLHSLLF